ncbi:MAG TPA: hypothetical protein VJT73_00100 [Polyangiaceae bacterium]|nr:hypothetical protein [Polyangiaceae bacterium]
MTTPRVLCYGTGVRSLVPSIFATFLLVVGCRSGAMQQGPSDTLRSYAKALDEGRPDDAYKLLSSEAKRSISLDAFRRMVGENAPEMKDIARALARPSSDPVVTATVTSPKGETITLVYEEGRWKLDGSAINLYGQTSPKQSVEAFLRAFERKRYDVMLRFVPDGHLEGLDAEKLRAAWEGSQKEEMLRITTALKAALATARFEETGDRATMAYGAGGTVQLVREHGAWKIEDFD